MRVLGLVCARGGSKGVPGKNIKPLLGRPLLCYAIDAARASRRIARVVVSTDAPEIAEVATQAGAEVPFLRPAELARDDSLQIDAIRHAIGWLETRGDRYDAVALLQPTCPLREAGDVDGALERLEATGADSVISVTRVTGHHPKTYYAQDESARLTPLLESDEAGVLRQDFPALYWRNGAVYATRRDVLMERRSLYGDDTRAFEMPPERSINIDEPMDWILAEAMLRHLHGAG